MLLHKPLGDYMARVPVRHASPRHRARRLPRAGMMRRPTRTGAATCARLLGISFVGVLFLYVFLRIQQHFWPPYHVPQMNERRVVFQTRRRASSPQHELAVVLGRERPRLRRADGGPRRAEICLGSRWHARSRSPSSAASRAAAPTAWALLGRPDPHLHEDPAAIGVVFRDRLRRRGMIQNFHDYTSLHTIAGGTQTLPAGRSPARRSSRSSATNGGGSFHAKLSVLVREPDRLDELDRDLPAAVHRLLACRAPLGRMVNDKRQGYAIVAVYGRRCDRCRHVDRTFQGIHMAPFRRQSARRRRGPSRGSAYRTPRSSPPGRRSRLPVRSTASTTRTRVWEAPSRCWT